MHPRRLSFDGVEVLLSVVLGLAITACIVLTVDPDDLWLYVLLLQQ